VTRLQPMHTMVIGRGAGAGRVILQILENAAAQTAVAVSAMLDRLLDHAHLLKCGPRSWRTKTELPANAS
jgi:hypothetical protein